MSDRERWVVYPLVFLALGLALRDKLTRSVEGLAYLGGKSVSVDLASGYVQTRVLDAHTIRCERLEVQQATGAPLVLLGGVNVGTQGGKQQTSGAISIHGHDGQEIVVLRANHALKGELVRKESEGQEAAELVLEVREVTEEGGLVEVFDGGRTLSLLLAHGTSQSGLFAKNSQGQLAQLSRVVRRPETPPAGDQPAAGSRPAPNLSPQGPPPQTPSPKSEPAEQAPPAGQPATERTEPPRPPQSPDPPAPAVIDTEEAQLRE